MDHKAFDYKRIAIGYKERPFLHKNVIELLQREIPIQGMERGLDIGCGAGLSSKALKLICNHVTGTDISEHMIEAAREVCNQDGFNFFVCKAEEIPEPEKKYDIVTAAGVIQWIEQEKFLKNLYKIISNSGVLIIYDFWITDRMIGTDEYTDWWNHKYLKKFPRPTRNDKEWTQDEVEKYGFSFTKKMNFEIKVPFNKESFIKFMMIQSNVNAKNEACEISEKEAEIFFRESLETIFDRESKTIMFQGYRWYIHKNDKDICIEE